MQFDKTTIYIQLPIPVPPLGFEAVCVVNGAYYLPCLEGNCYLGCTAGNEMRVMTQRHN